MGMFDSLHVECPNCGRMVEFQSKAGECCLERYTLRDIPPKVALDLDGETEVCECGKVMRLDVQSMVVVTPRTL